MEHDPRQEEARVWFSASVAASNTGKQTDALIAMPAPNLSMTVWA